MSSLAEDRNNGVSIFRMLFTINFLISFGFCMSDSFFPAYFQNLGANAALIGFSASSYQISKIVLGPFVGRLEQRFGSGRLIVVSLLIYVVVSISYLVLNSLYILVLLRFLQGAACSSLKPIMYSMINGSMSEGKKGEVFGAFDISFYASIAAGPFVGGWIIHSYGFEALFAVLLFICLLAALVSFSLNRICLLRQKQDEHVCHVSRPSRTEYSLYLFIVGKSFLIACYTVYFPLFLLNECHFTTLETGFTISFSTGVMALFLRPMGKLSDRVSKPLLVVAGGILSSIAFFHIQDIFTFKQAMVFSALFGLCGAISQPASVSLLFSCSSDKSVSSSVMGRFGSILNIGFVCGTLFASLMIELFSVRAAFISAGIINLFMITLYVFSTGSLSWFGHSDMISDR